MKDMTVDEQKEFNRVDWKVLYELRYLEAVETQAQARGGWGRLSLEEFEKILKREDAAGVGGNGRRAMMDYLGSWIEFCIP